MTRRAITLVVSAAALWSCGGDFHEGHADIGDPLEHPGADYYVSPAGSDEAEGDADAPWRTLEHAVAQADSFSTIHLAAGIYPGRITVTRPLVLEGAGRSQTTLAASGEGPVIEASADLTLRDLSVSGLEDWGGGYAAHSVRELVRVTGAHLSALRLGAYNFSSYGLTVEDGAFSLRDVTAGIDPATPGGPGSYALAADIGLRLIRSSGTVDGFSSGAPPRGRSGHFVDHQIRLEPGAGDSILVRDVVLYGYGREPGEGWADGIQIYALPAPPTALVRIESSLIEGPEAGLEASSGVEVMGGDVDLVLIGNTIRGFGRGLHFSAQAGLGSALLESNLFEGNTDSAVRIFSDVAVDMGDGPLRSAGGNRFLGNGRTIVAADSHGRPLDRVFHAVNSTWGTCEEAEILAGTVGRVRVLPAAGCG